jgi:hypothetical protein
LRALGFAFAALVAAACAPRVEQPDAGSIRAARQAALQFDQRMAREIIARLQRDEDPVAVWLAYADQVPDWGREISNAVEVEFSRTALGVRNPANAPDDWERQQMEQMGFMLDAGLDAETLDVAEIRYEGDETVFRWMRPILMTEECLVCHGENIGHRVRLLLGQEYPLDEATGYSANQLGGAYSVRQVLSVGGKPPPPWSDIPAPVVAPADARANDDAPLVAASPPDSSRPAPDNRP